MRVHIAVADQSLLTSICEMVPSFLVSTAQPSTVLMEDVCVKVAATLIAVSVCRLQVKSSQTTCTTCLYSWSR